MLSGPPGKKTFRIQIKHKKFHYLQQNLTFTIVINPTEPLRCFSGLLDHLECVFLNLILYLACVLILKVNVTLPGPRIFLLEAVNDNATGVLYAALN